MYKVFDTALTVTVVEHFSKTQKTQSRAYDFERIAFYNYLKFKFEHCLCILQDCINNYNDLRFKHCFKTVQKSYTVSNDKDIGTVSKVARYQNSYTVSKDKNLSAASKVV